MYTAAFVRDGWSDKSNVWQIHCCRTFTWEEIGSKLIDDASSKSTKRTFHTATPFTMELRSDRRWAGVLYRV